MKYYSLFLTVSGFVMGFFLCEYLIEDIPDYREPAKASITCIFTTVYLVLSGIVKVPD